MKKLFDTYKGKSVYLYTLKEENIEVDIIDFGARINSIRVNGIDIVLGCNKV
jgi:galactose mutarotase-like enzyme